jgi:hypothetical protein
VTNTRASPAAVFAGTQAASVGEFVVGEPHVSRLTPTVSGGQLGDVELEGWVTSSPVMAQDYNSSRSNKQKSRSADGDADGDGLGDADEDDELVAYLGGEPIVAERFTVCLPDAEVPGGNGSIREEVTPERLIAYLTGESDGEGRVYSWGPSKTAGSDGGGDCDDSDSDVYPGAVCGTTPHFIAEVSGPMATGGGLEVVRSDDGSVFLLSGDRSADGARIKTEMLMTLSADPIIAGPDGDGSDTSCSDDDPCGPGVWTRTTESGSSSGVSVYQVMVQPPRCPKPFPAVLYVQRCESNDQLVYTGGWVIDDAALYEDSVTVLSMAGPTEVVGVGLSDLGGSFEDVAGGSADWEWPRVRRGARLDSGTVAELVETGVLSESGGVDYPLRKRPGREAEDEDEVTLEVTGDEYGFVTHVTVDVLVRHLVSASRASQDVKFKAGAELSKAVN